VGTLGPCGRLPRRWDGLAASDPPGGKNFFEGGGGGGGRPIPIGRKRRQGGGTCLRSGWTFRGANAKTQRGTPVAESKNSPDPTERAGSATPCTDEKDLGGQKFLGRVAAAVLGGQDRVPWARMPRRRLGGRLLRVRFRGVATETHADLQRPDSEYETQIAGRGNGSAGVEKISSASMVPSATFFVRRTFGVPREPHGDQ